MRINENEGPNGKKGKFSQIWIRPNMDLDKSFFFFFCIDARAFGGEKRRRREEKKRKRRRNPGLEISYVMYGVIVWKFGTLVWKLFGLLVWKYHKSLLI